MATTSRFARTMATFGVLAGLGMGTAGLVGLQLDGAPVPAVATPAPVEVAITPQVVRTPSPAVRVPTPTRIEVPAIGVDERLTGRGLKADDSLDTPDFGDAAWYAPGPRPGEPGGAVVVAHVHGPDGPDVFWDLATLEPGELIRVHRPDAVLAFVVEQVEDVAKDALPHDRIWPDTEAPLLRLITCGGRRSAAGYPDNTVVYARLASITPVR